MVKKMHSKKRYDSNHGKYEVVWGDVQTLNVRNGKHISFE